MDAYHERASSFSDQRTNARAAAQSPRAPADATDPRDDWHEERAALLSELEAARRTAADSARQRDELFSAIAHELRGPLNSIFGWTQLLQGGRLDADQQARALDAIVRGTQAQTRLIDHLLDISRALGGRLRISPARLDASEPLQGAVDAVIERAAAKGVVIVTFIDAGVHVHADAPRLRQLFGHLLDNAVRCTPQGGTVGVHLAAEHGMATIRIEDSGIGIEPDALAQVFEPFRRADPAAGRSAGRGLGVGLALARATAALHGGSIEARSAGRDRGAAFNVRLPLAAIDDTPRRSIEPGRGSTDYARRGSSQQAEDCRIRDLISATHVVAGNHPSSPAANPG